MWRFIRMMGHKKEGPERHSLKFGDSIVQPMINVLKFLLGEGGAKKQIITARHAGKK